MRAGQLAENRVQRQILLLLNHKTEQHETMRYLLPVLVFIVGAGISYINYLISRKAMNASGGGAVLSGAHFFIRQILNIGFLVGVYFLAVKGGYNLFAMLLCAALGLTVSSFLFTFMLTRRMGTGTQNQNGTSETGTSEADAEADLNAEAAADTDTDGKEN